MAAVTQQKGPSWQTAAGFLQYWPSQTPEAPLLIFMHGIESHGNWFADTAVRIQLAGYRVLAWDRPGFGRSDDHLTAVSVRGHLDSRAALLVQFDRLLMTLEQYALLANGQAFHLCGLSWGGLAALYIAGKRPERVLSLSLLVPGLSSRLLFSWREQARILTSGSRSRRGKKMVTLPITPAMFTQDLAKQAYLRNDPYRTLQVTRGFCRTTLALMLAIRNPLSRFRRSVRPPSLCLLAETDAVLVKIQVQRVLSALGIACHTIPATHHSLVLEAPERVADLISKHLRDSDGAL